MVVILIVSLQWNTLAVRMTVVSLHHQFRLVLTSLRHHWFFPQHPPTPKYLPRLPLDVIQAKIMPSCLNWKVAMSVYLIFLWGCRSGTVPNGFGATFLQSNLVPYSFLVMICLTKTAAQVESTSFTMAFYSNRWVW